MNPSPSTARDVTISIVSHGQNRMVNDLLHDLARVCPTRVVAIVTENIADSAPLETEGMPFPTRTVRNANPKGYGANNNAAFGLSDTPYFCVSNPDIRLSVNPFPVLMSCLSQPPAGAAGPRVGSPDGTTEDSARRFPTVTRLLRKAILGSTGPDYASSRRGKVDWVAGMFMLFRADAFAKVRGFDERFFLYYEDVDICRRLQRAGFDVLYEPAISVVHDARRESHRNARFAWLHAKSVLRYLFLSGN